MFLKSKFKGKFGKLFKELAEREMREFIEWAIIWSLTVRGY